MPSAREVKPNTTINTTKYGKCKVLSKKKGSKGTHDITLKVIKTGERHVMFVPEKHADYDLAGPGPKNEFL